MTIGAIVVLFAVLAVFLFKGSVDFKEQNTEFVVKFMNDLSNNWHVSDVYPRLTNEMVQRSESPDAKRFFGMSRQLGKLVSIQDVELQNYHSGTDAVVGIFVFKAEFEHGQALVTVTLQEKEGKVQVQALNINPTEVPFFSNKSSEFGT